MEARSQQRGRCQCTNDTQKTIKYVYFDVVPYNAVKDA